MEPEHSRSENALAHRLRARADDAVECGAHSDFIGCSWRVLSLASCKKLALLAP